MITDNVHRRKKPDQIRCQKTLTCQIKNDYIDCQKIWARITNNETDFSETEKVLQLIAWIKSGINELQGIAGKTIEGFSWGEMKIIQRETDLIQNEIRKEMKRSIF